MLFKSAERKDLASIVAFLHQLADKLASNQGILQQGSAEIDVDIPNNIILELKVEEEDKEGKVKRICRIFLSFVVGCGNRWQWQA